MTLRNKISYLKGYLKGLFEFEKTNNIPNSNVMLYCHDFTRNYSFNNLHYSSIIDSVGDLFKYTRPITIARPYSSLDIKKCYGRVHKVNGKFARARLIDLIFNKFGRQIKDKYKILFWGEVLDKVRPKVILGVEPDKELCIAAKKRGIIVFDFQHGIIAAEPTANYYRLEHRAPNQEGWPDYIVCRDRPSKNWLNTFRGNYTNPIVTTHPWFARFINRHQNDELVNEFSKKIHIKKKNPVILYSLQHLRDKAGRPHLFAPIPPMIIKYMMSERGKKFDWWFRLHPILLADSNYSKVLKILEEKFAGLSNVFWDFPTTAPLPYLLNFVDLHFTRDSSMTMEVAIFNIKTGLLDMREKHSILRNVFKKELKNKMAKIIPLDEQESLIHFIDQSIVNRKAMKNPFYDLLEVSELISEIEKGTDSVESPKKGIEKAFEFSKFE